MLFHTDSVQVSLETLRTLEGAVESHGGLQAPSFHVPLWPSLGSVRSSDSEARRQQCRVLFPRDNSQFTLWGQQMRVSAPRLPSFQATSDARYR